MHNKNKYTVATSHVIRNSEHLCWEKREAKATQSLTSSFKLQALPFELQHRLQVSLIEGRPE